MGISIDPPGDNKAFQEKFSFPYDLLSDEDTSMTAAYGVDLTDSGRTSRKSVLVGPDGTVAKAYDSVTPAEHPDEVLADLVSLS